MNGFRFFKSKSTPALQQNNYIVLYMKKNLKLQQYNLKDKFGTKLKDY